MSKKEFRCGTNMYTGEVTTPVRGHVLPVPSSDSRERYATGQLEIPTIQIYQNSFQISCVSRRLWIYFYHNQLGVLGIHSGENVETDLFYVCDRLR